MPVEKERTAIGRERKARRKHEVAAKNGELKN